MGFGKPQVITRTSLGTDRFKTLVALSWVNPLEAKEKFLKVFRAKRCSVAAMSRYYDVGASTLMKLAARIGLSMPILKLVKQNERSKYYVYRAGK